MLQARAHRRVRHMQLELSIRANVRNTSSGCPFFSLHVLLYCLPFYFPLTFFLLQVVPPLFSPSPTLSLSFTLLPRDICCPKTICLSPLSGHSLCPLPSSKGIFRLQLMCLTECILAFSTLVFIRHLLFPVSHYSHCSLLKRDVVRNYK